MDFDIGSILKKEIAKKQDELRKKTDTQKSSGPDSTSVPKVEEDKPKIDIAKHKLDNSVNEDDLSLKRKKTQELESRSLRIEEIISTESKISYTINSNTIGVTKESKKLAFNTM